MRRAGTSEPGMDLLARREAPFAAKPRASPAGFFNERAVHKPQSKKKINSTKNLVYHRESEGVKSGLRLARQDEWGEWREFNAAVPFDS
eukprot:8464264-Pyramimonas_sp.AAC.1